MIIMSLSFPLIIISAAICIAVPKSYCRYNVANNQDRQPKQHKLTGEELVREFVRKTGAQNFQSEGSKKSLSVSLSRPRRSSVKTSLARSSRVGNMKVITESEEEYFDMAIILTCKSISNIGNSRRSNSTRRPSFAHSIQQ